MALEEPGRRRSKRNRNMRQAAQTKLNVGDKVEVRSEEEGFLGSWHSGTVTACTKGFREVAYDHILCDDESGNIVEAVSVSPILDGIGFAMDEHSTHRGSIRPQPPKTGVGIYDLPYGLCVDVYYLEAWWEGVVFDHEGDSDSEKRKIFFPDLGDELTFGIDNLRITQDWDEVTDKWKGRGTWIFLELIEQYEDRFIAVSVKQIWYDVQLKKGFDKVREWTSPMRDIWEELVLEVIDDNFSITVDEVRQVLEMAGCLTQEFQGELEPPQCVSDSCVNSESYMPDSLAIVPVENPLDKISLAERDDNVRNVLDCRARITDEQHENEGLSIDPDTACVQHVLDKSYMHQLVAVTGDDNSYAKSDISSDGMSVTKSRKKGGRTSNWLPVKLLKEFCPDSVDTYANVGKGRHPSSELQTAIRKHLLYLGWKVETMKDNYGVRYRYMSPDGDPEYSLIKVCSIIKKSQEVSQFSVSQDAHQGSHGSPGQPFFIEQPKEVQHPNYCSSSELLKSEVFIYKPEYCPEAVKEYVETTVRGPRNLIVKALRYKAKKHLSAVGWEFIYSEVKSSNNLRFRSPEGNVYNSLLNACKDCVDGNYSERTPIQCRYVVEEDMGQLNKRQIGSGASRKQKRKRTCSLLGGAPHLHHRCLKDQSDNSPKVKRRKTSPSLFGCRNDPGVSRPTRVLMISKRVQEVVTPTSTHQHPCTILSWLIDNNVVLPREKVHYCNRKGDAPRAEGKISREGIKCSCCQKVWTLSCFETHAGIKETDVGCSYHTPASNIFLDDGRSLLDCQMQIIHKIRKRTSGTEQHRRLKGNRIRDKNDHICAVCHYGGDLLLCDQCPSSFHKSCLGLKDVPDGDWFCPSCCCGACSQSKLKKDKEPILTCGQCEHKYHAGCLRIDGLTMPENDLKGIWFCSKNCKRISLGLHKVLGKQIPVGVDDLTWSLLKSSESDFDDSRQLDNDAITESLSRLSIALGVMHECFEPVKEPLTRRDLAEDIIFSRRSDLNRLNFQGFYTMILEKNDKLITVATIRIYGQKVAEVPLIATRSQYRRHGMCRVLMNLLEKMLVDLGVERLVLPAVRSVLNTWTNAFGFSRMTNQERLQFLDCTFLYFQGTIMCQKLLTKMPPAQLSSLKGMQPIVSGSGDNIDQDQSNSPVSEVCQPDSPTECRGLEKAAGKKRRSYVCKQYKRKRTSVLAVP